MSFLSVEVSRQRWVCQRRYAVVGANHLVDFVLESLKISQMRLLIFSLCGGRRKTRELVGAEGGLPSSLCRCRALCCKRGRCKHALCVPAHSAHTVHWRSGLAVWLRSRVESFWRSSLLHGLPAGS